jgi:hypothetical protein
MRELVRYRQEHLTGDEKGEGQVFLERLFQAFGHGGVRQAGAFFEARLRRRVAGQKRTSARGYPWRYIDRNWQILGSDRIGCQAV